MTDINDIFSRIKGRVEKNVEDFEKAQNAKKEEAKQQGISQLEGQFPQTTNEPRACGSRYVHVTVGNQEYTVIGTPTYEHNIADGTYTLKSVEYRVENGHCEMENDYKNNIVENMPVDSNTNVQDLKDKFENLNKTIAEKTTQLRQLMDKISGNGNDFEGFSYEPIDYNSPDAVEKLAKQIEDATAFISKLDIQIKQKRMEYDSKTQQCLQCKDNLNAVLQELDEAEQLLKDLCAHYGTDVPNVTHSDVALEGNRVNLSLDELISYYNTRIECQKDNLANVNEAIDNVKVNSEVQVTESNSTKEVDEELRKTSQLYKNLCIHYGITPKDFNELINLALGSYDIGTKKNVIKEINEEIDKLVSSNGKEANPDKLTDDEIEQQKTQELEQAAKEFEEFRKKAFEKFLRNKPFFPQNK